jgi:acetylornithine deacetylase/succinyl-diaminopimelate desuccinylase-like protein
MKAWIEHFDRALDRRRSAEIAARTVDIALAIQRIPAPTFDEAARAAYMAEQFRRLGLLDIEIDELYNVYGRRAGRTDAGGVMIAAHTDTVFSAETDLSVRRAGDTLYAPGLGDNSAGVAGMWALATYLCESNITPACDLWFVATTREEGLGDLGGMRAAFDHLAGRIACVVNIEGLAFGHVYNAGIAVRRFHITASAPGGHSWLHYGRASAVHAILQLGAKLTEIRPSEQPRTTYNVGMIEGGESINSIATRAGLWLDLRSESSAALALLEERVRTIVRALPLPEVHFHIEVVGDRPAGLIPIDHPLVMGALAALETVGVRGSLESGSTDANVPLSRGIPAVTIGITRGGNAHRLDEYMDIAPIESGLRQLYVLAQASAAWAAEGTPEKGNA